MVNGVNLWYVGVALEVVSTMSGTIGKQLIRLSETKKRKNPHFAKIAFTVGLVVNTVCGPLLDMAAYSFATQSLIAPFGGLDVVWNAALAPYILNEKLTKRRIVGCILILTGTIMAGFFGNHEDAEYSLAYLEDTLVNVRVLLYFVAFAVWFLVNNFVFMRRPEGSAIRGVSLGCTAGSIAGNMFCVKGAIELIQRSIHSQEGEIWLHWLPYVLLLGAAFFALSNVVYMTKGLQEYEALFMVTIYEGSMIVSGCVSGAVVLMDLKGCKAWRVALYFLAIVIIMAGMYVIFSNEAMSKSSIISGSASIKVPPSPRSSRKDTFDGRSLHSVVNPILDSPERSRSDPSLRSPKGDGKNSFAFNEDDPEGGDKATELVDQVAVAKRQRAESAPAQFQQAPAQPDRDAEKAAPEPVAAPANEQPKSVFTL
uniref:EamA domain-containing protein n=1 Tax=Alexandrium catenella TaxID=2925 RepID=A0A7S1KVX2_ALECA|mmetsp:Transcript_101595/g.270178  ORF Transcript_101595/g.270178 Transcript_101595/m.270178 type:complete len:425 (+) Transcript_101595:46-1320(+)